MNPTLSTKTSPKYWLITIIASILFAFGSLIPTTSHAEYGYAGADANAKPTRYVGKVHVFLRNGQVTIGSGTLIANRIVLTAAHVISQPGMVTAMFTPGSRGGRAPYGSANMTKAAVSLGYLEGTARFRDFAILQLNKGLGERTGGYAALGEWKTGWKYTTTAYGYPKISPEWPVKHTTLTYVYANPVDSHSWHIYWSTDSVGLHPSFAAGWSGGGTFISGTNTQVGIVTHLSNERDRKLQGLRLSHTVLDEIQTWTARNR